MENGKYTVYAHELYDGRLYIGCTCQTTSKRWGVDGRGYAGTPFYKAIQEYGWDSFSIVTKSHHVADDEYLAVMDKDLAHIQVTVTTLDDALCATYEKASPPSKRIEAIKRLQDEGFDVAIRLSPIIEEYMDFDALNGLGINKAIVEFLRVNTWIKKWFTGIDYKPYKLKQGSYRFLRLNDKKRIISKIQIPQISVCKDYQPHWKY